MASLTRDAGQFFINWRWWKARCARVDLEIREIKSNYNASSFIKYIFKILAFGNMVILIDHRDPVDWSIQLYSARQPIVGMRYLYIKCRLAFSRDAGDSLDSITHLYLASDRQTDEYKRKLYYSRSYLGGLQCPSAQWRKRALSSLHWKSAVVKSTGQWL